MTNLQMDSPQSGELLFQILIVRRGEPWLTMNKTKNMHYMAEHRARMLWWRATAAACLQAKVRPPQFGFPPTELEFTFMFATNRRRDPSNYFANVKPIVDELVRRGFWPDDNPRYVVERIPVLKISPTKTEGVVIRGYVR